MDNYPVTHARTVLGRLQIDNLRRRLMNVRLAEQGLPLVDVLGGALLIEWWTNRVEVLENRTKGATK